MSNKKIDNILENNGPEELSDDALDAVTGGTGTDTVVTLKYRVGEVVVVTHDTIRYCQNCARLLKNYKVTITGIRGILDGVPLYWVKRSCCGHNSSVSEKEILYRV